MYRSVLCHLHSTFEGPASITGYCHAAAQVGVDAIWLSDHDSRVPGVTNYVNRFQPYVFGQNDSFVPQLNERGRPEKDYWSLSGEGEPDLWRAQNAADGSCLQLQTRSEGPEFKGATMRLLTPGKTHHRSLLSDPVWRLRFADLPPAREQMRLSVMVHLSQRPPEHKSLTLTYVWGGPAPQGLSLPLPVQDGVAELDISKDAGRLGLGLDHTTRHLEIRLESKDGFLAQVCLQSVELETGVLDPEQLFAAQLALGQQIGQEYGVAVLVGTEISAGKEHRTCFGEDVPFFPYAQHPSRPSQHLLNEHVVKHGGITSINHVFSALKNDDLTPRQREEALAAKAAELIREKGYGSRLLEVGYPIGRHGFHIDYYLRLWDQLNLAGLRIYGIGVSDAHGNMDWTEKNNFANYVASPDTTAKNLTAGMRAGNFYMADPHRLRGRVDFRSDQGKAMGQTQKGGSVELHLAAAPSASVLTWIVDGQVRQEETVSGLWRSSIDVAEGEYFVRAQLQDAEGRVILLTNPLWLA